VEVKTIPAEPAQFRRIADEIRTEILSGRLKPGQKLPSENELKDTYATTRATVAKALALLRADGLIVSEQGRGSFVRARPRVRLLSAGANYRSRRDTGVSNFNAEATAQGQQATQHLLAVENVVPPPEIADRLGTKLDELVLVRRRIFTVGDEPMQLVDGYYPLALASGTALASSRRIKGGVHSVIEDPDGPIKRRVVQFVEDLEIRMPTPSESETLRIAPGVPVVRILRTSYDAAEMAVEVLDSLVPTDRHILRYVIDVP
jgi:GntR family transcriptional regulator